MFQTLNYFQSKIYPEDVSELCRFCEEEPETFDHLLNECPCFQQARFNILHNQPIIHTTKWDSKEIIIAFSHIPVIDAALTFEWPWVDCPCKGLSWLVLHCRHPWVSLPRALMVCPSVFVRSGMDACLAHGVGNWDPIKGTPPLPSISGTDH